MTCSAAPIGSVWATGSWSDTAWCAGTWAEAVIPPAPPVQEGGAMYARRVPDFREPIDVEEDAILIALMVEILLHG